MMQSAKNRLEIQIVKVLIFWGEIIHACISISMDTGQSIKWLMEYIGPCTSRVNNAMNIIKEINIITKYMHNATVIYKTW